MTNGHESPTEMIILSDVTMAAGFKLGITKLCPLLERLLFLCTGLKMSATAQAVFGFDGLYEKPCWTLSNECKLVFKMNLKTKIYPIVLLCTHCRWFNLFNRLPS